MGRSDLTGNRLELRPLDHRDSRTAAEILSLQRAAYRVEADLVGSDAIPPLTETLEALVTADETFLGAFAGGELVGAVSWKVVEEALDIHRLVVDPGRHRQGVGRRLVREALAAHPGLPAIVQTGAANRPARALYERLGFALVDEIEPVPGLRVVRLARAGA